MIASLRAVLRFPIRPQSHPALPAIIVGLLGAAPAVADPDIRSLTPLAIRPGVSVELKISGTDVARAETLWTSFPSAVKRSGPGSFQVAAKCSNGLGAIRVAGSNGVSNLRFIVIDDLPSAPESSTNQSRATAQPVAFGSAVDGACAELACDWFRLRLNKGEAVVIETIAARLGSRLDSIVRVVGGRGHELARNDDAPGQFGDSRVHFTAPASGEYFIEVRDANYAGGAAFFYRLRVSGSTLPSTMVGDTDRLAAPARMEREPNDNVSQATRIASTNTVRGRFDRAGDRDRFEFRARKGERLEFRAATRSIGSACDALLELHSTDGKRLARSNPSAADEGVLTHQFAESGIYRLAVEEASGAFGPEMHYEIVVRPSAGFAVGLDTDRVNVVPGKSFELKLTLARGDYKGAVTAKVEGLPGAFTVTNSAIAEGKTNVTLRLTAPETLMPGTWQTFSIVGVARRDGREVRVRASTASAWRKQLPLRLYPPPEFDGEITLGVAAP